MKCILILEDEPLIAMDLQLAFEDAGAEAVVTVSCDEAMNRGRKERKVVQ